MLTMIFVNDIAGVPDTIVPGWLKHFHGKDGMTFVDLVFPAFLFIVGVSIPLALGRRLSRGEPRWKVFAHVLWRSVALLAIGILMVNGTPNSRVMGWSGPLWTVLMYSAAVLAFCQISPWNRDGVAEVRERRFRAVSLGLRVLGVVVLVFLALAYRGENGERLLALSPLAVRTQWYGILGLIGWAYLIGSTVFLAFGASRTALLGMTVLLLSLYPAEQTGAFEGFWLARYVGIGSMLGSHPGITLAGVLLGTLLMSGEPAAAWPRIRFALLFVAGFAAAAWLLHGLYGINKNSATPSWCLWACAITALLWVIFYLVADVLPGAALARPLAVAGQNVFLAYLLSNLWPCAVVLFGLGAWYGALAEPSLAHAIARSSACAVLILGVSAGLNRLGFRLKL
jgi:predicted acyltransferase